MDNQTTVKERLIIFIKHLGIGQARFEINCGLSNGYVNNIRRSVSYKKLQAITNRYPNLNPGWLLTGDGSMLYTEQISNSEKGSNSKSLTDADWINSENERLNNRVDELIEQNRLLIETLHTQMGIIKKTCAQTEEDAECADVV